VSVVEAAAPIAPAHPSHPVEAGRVEPVAKRIRAYLGGVKVIDTTRALYVWEIAAFPQFYIPADDVLADALIAEDAVQSTHRGDAELYALEAGGERRPHAVKSYAAAAVPGLAGTMRFDFGALDAWYEEDELLFGGHPRSPFVRVDALRSTRAVRVELEGVLLAEARACVMVFETGLQTRYYLDRSALALDVLEPSDTVTTCPYKGVTSAYWSARVGGELRADVAWSYAFPTRELLPIAGLVAFYNEKVDIALDGQALER
jgi:uncharacterized protein (DUF427 family)